MKKIIILGVLLFVSISGCTQTQNINKPTQKSASTVPTIEQAFTSTATSLPPTSTVIPPTATNTAVPPTPTSIPTIQYPVTLGTSFPELRQPITSDNLGQVKEVAEYWGNPISATFLATANGKVYVFTSEGIRIYDEKGTPSRKIDIHPFYPHRSYGDIKNWSSISNDGTRIAILDENQMITILSDTGEILGQIEKPRCEPYDVHLNLSPDGKFLAIDSAQPGIYLKLYDIERGVYANIPQIDPWQLSFSYDSQFLFAKRTDTGNIEVYGSPDWKLLTKVVTKGYDPIYDYFQIPNSNLLQLSIEGKIVVANFLTGKETFRISNDQMSSYDFPLDVPAAVYKRTGGEIIYIDLETGEILPSEPERLTGSLPEFIVPAGPLEDIEGIQNPFNNIQLWGPFLDVSTKNAGQFTFRQKDGLEIILEAGQISCKIKISGKTECKSTDQKMITSGDMQYLAAINVTKATKNGRVLEVQTDISSLDASANILGSLPEAGDVIALCPDYSIAFYTPIDMNGDWGPTPRGQLSVYDYMNNKQLLSFDTKEKEYVYGFCPLGSPYAVTILNNAVNREDQFNIQYLDGSAETYANNFYKTKNNTQPVVAVDPGNKFFAIVSNLPPTMIDHLKVDHLILNLVYFSNPKDQIVLEIPPLSRTDIPEFQADRHSSTYEAIVNDLEISPDGKLAAIATFTGKVVFVDLATGDIVGEIQTNAASVDGLTFSGDWSYMATYDRTGIVKVFGIPE